MLIQSPIVTRSLSLRTSLYSLIASALISGVLSTAPLIGWSRYTLEGAFISCGVDWKSKNSSAISYNIFIFIVTFFFPFLGIVVANLKIIFTVRQKIQK